MGDDPAAFAMYERLLLGHDAPTFEELLGRPAWMKDGACREPHEGVTFFPVQGENAEPAKAVCRGCLVRQECLETALSQWGTSGVWGGLSEKERKRLRRAA